MSVLTRRHSLCNSPKSMFIASLSAAFLFFLSSPAFAQAPSIHQPSQELYEGSYADLAMGTLVSVRVFSPDEKKIDEALNLFQEKIEEYATLFTVHDQGALNEVNVRSGSWVNIDCKVAGVIETAKTLAKDSDQAFEPTIGTLVNVWKIGFGGTQHPDKKDIQAALKKVDYRQVKTDLTPGACRAKINPGQSLDLGAIAKGWMGTALVADLAAIGIQHAIVDLGGNVALLGQSTSGRLWKIGVQRPDAERGTTMAVIAGRDESIITSGAYERNIESKGKRYGHILSVKTGEPVATDIGSVTIVDVDGAKADGWCTALFALGTQKAVAMLKKHKNLKAFIVDDQLKHAWVSKSLVDRVTLLDNSIKITVID